MNSNDGSLEDSKSPISDGRRRAAFYVDIYSQCVILLQVLVKDDRFRCQELKTSRYDRPFESNYDRIAIRSLDSLNYFICIHSIFNL